MELFNSNILLGYYIAYNVIFFKCHFLTHFKLLSFLTLSQNVIMAFGRNLLRAVAICRSSIVTVFSSPNPLVAIEYKMINIAKGPSEFGSEASNKVCIKRKLRTNDLWLNISGMIGFDYQNPSKLLYITKLTQH